MRLACETSPDSGASFALEQALRVAVRLRAELLRQMLGAPFVPFDLVHERSRRLDAARSMASVGHQRALWRA